MVREYNEHATRIALVARGSAITQAKDGTFKGGVTVGTLANGGVALAPFHDFDSAIPAALKREIDNVRRGIIDGSITVGFNDGSQYLYTDASAGTSNIEQMKNLAQRGEGLNSFIMKHVRKGYTRKLR